MERQERRFIHVPSNYHCHNMEEEPPVTTALEQEVYPNVEINPERQIRVLTLLPSEDRSPEISCEMSVLTLPVAEAPGLLQSLMCMCEYHALSYAWGSETGSIPLNINCRNGNLKVTDNLWMALLRLRRRSSSRPL